MTQTPELLALKAFIDERPPLGVAVVARTPADDPRPGEPATLALAGDAREYFYDVIDQAVGAPIASDDWRQLPLDPVYKPEKHDLEVVALEDVPAVELACETYANLGPYGDFTGEDAFVRRLKYYVAVLGAPGNEQAFFFRSFSSSAELKRKRGAALMRRDASSHGSRTRYSCSTTRSTALSSASSSM